MQKKLDSVRIQLPKGPVYDALIVAQRVHGASSLSKYILVAAWKYTESFLKQQAEKVNAKQAKTQDTSDSPQPRSLSDDASS